jgi:chromosome segregation ATPase
MASPPEFNEPTRDTSPSGDDDRQSKFYAASLAAIERFSEQLDRKDRLAEKKDERMQALEREVVVLRASTASLQRANDDARSAYNAAQIDRQVTLDRMVAEIDELRSVRDELRESDLARGQLLGKIAVLRTESERDRETVRVGTAELETERERLVALSRENTVRAQRLDAIELEHTRAQIAAVDALLGQIHRSFFWKLKLALATLRGSLRSIARTAVRR